jgi:hypothetical protein
VAEEVVTVDGLSELLEAFANFPTIAAGEISKAVEKALLLLQGAAADYPPKPPESTYRRTGTLGRLWTSAARVVEENVSGAFVVGRVGNATPYGPYVQDPKEQAKVHRGRWKTTEQIVQEHRAEIDDILAEAGAQIVERIAEEAE